MNDNWDKSLIEVLDSLSKSKPKKTYMIGIKLSDIICLKFIKKNVRIKGTDHLLSLMEGIIMKCNYKIFDIVNSVKEKDIPIELDPDLEIVNKQRWINFKKICKICKTEKSKIVSL